MLDLAKVGGISRACKEWMCGVSDIPSRVPTHDRDPVTEKREDYYTI